MWPKLLIVVACLYVVGASVVPSILDDEDASNLPEVSRTARSCGFASCNSFCRKLGHARGVCIGTYCQCRFRRRRSLDEEAAADNAIESNEKPVESNEETFEGNIDVEPETFVAVAGDKSSEKVTVRSCGYAECNSFCRKLGYARGVCIGTYCQCRYRLAPLLLSANLTQVGAVDDEEIGDKPPLSSDEKEEDVSEHGRVARAARPCSTEGCSAHCRRLGHARGVCIGSYCQCRSRLARSTDLEEGSTVEKTDSDNKKPPIPSDEETFVGIIIIKSKTSADDIAEADKLAEIKDNTIEDNLITTDEEESVLQARSEDCNLRWCEQNCRRIGFPGGACVNGRCKCDTLRSASSVPAPFLKLDDEEDSSPNSRAVRVCTDAACRQTCRRLGFPFGRCSRNGRCFCWRHGL